MATINQVSLQVIGKNIETRKLPEAASQSFKKGELCYLVSGKVTVVASDGQVAFCVANEDATGTENTEIEVILLFPETKMEINCYHATAASAVTAASQVGENYALYRDSTNKRSFVDIGDASNVLFRVLDLSSKDAVGDQYGRLIVVIQGNYLQTGQAG